MCSTQTSPTQLVVVVFFEIILYTMNCMINLQFLKVCDVTYIIQRAT